MIEEKCKCGIFIPRGHGYYLGKPIICNVCGNLNQRKKPETPEEFAKLLEELN